MTAKKNINLLIKYLNNKFPNRVLVNFQNDYQLEACLDGIKFNINYLDGSYLVVYCNKSNKDVINSIGSCLNQFLSAKTPICFYDVVGKSNLSVMEWAFTNVEQRLSDIINNRELDDGDHVENVVLYNGKSADEYVEEKKQVVASKKYGTYPGYYVNSNIVSSLSEADIFLEIERIQKQIDELIKMKNNSQYSHNYGDDLDKIIIELEYTQDYLVAQTARFGVEFPDLPSSDRLYSESFLDWYSKYLIHFHYTLSERELYEYKELRAKGEDVSTYLPETESVRVRTNNDSTKNDM